MGRPSINLYTKFCALKLELEIEIESARAERRVRNQKSMPAVKITPIFPSIFGRELTEA